MRPGASRHTLTRCGATVWRALCPIGQPAGCRGRRTGGRPGCGCVPDATHNFPVRQRSQHRMGTGLDIRPNPGIGHPCWASYFPVTPRGARAAVNPVGCPGPRQANPRRGAAMRENTGGVIGAPRRLPGGMPADGVPADCRLRGGALRRQQDPTTPKFANVSICERAATGAHRRRQVGKVTRTPSANATVRVQFRRSVAGHPGGDRCDNLFGDRYLALKEEGPADSPILYVPIFTIPLARTQRR